MKAYSISKYKSSDKTEWDSFVDKAKNATFLFKRNFMEYHKDRFEDYSLLIRDEKNSLIALLPANKVNNTIYSHQGLTYGSFILHEKTKIICAFEAFKNMLEFLSLKGIKNIDIRVIPSFYNLLPADELLYFLFKANAKLIKRDVLMVIDYQHKIPFQKNRREGINKAIRNNISVEVDTNFDGFWNDVLIPNLNIKHGVKPVHSLKEIKLLAALFPENIKQISVYKDGKIIAGTTLFITNTTIHPQYVSGNKDKNSFGSLDLAYDFIINKFCTNKRYFDFNISSEENGSKLNKGLIFWKESCGARTFTSDNYVVNTDAFTTLNLNLI